jgi:WD40 repeat protein
VRRLSTGEVLHDFDGEPLGISHLQAGQDGQLYGFSPYRVTRIDPTTGKSIELMRGSDGPPESVLVKAVSPDGRSVLIAAQDVVELPNGRSIIRPSTPVTYRVRDLASGQLRWELSTTETRDSMGSFSPDGQRIGIQIGNRFEVWDYERNVQIYDSPLNLDTMVSNILFPDGRRVFGKDSIWDLRSGVQLSRVDIGNYYAVVNDSFLIAQYDGQLRYWRRRREEGSWSTLSFPEAWITGALAIACVCNVVLNSRGQRKRNEPAC